jgi:hypothetical protein
MTTAPLSSTIATVVRNSLATSGHDDREAPKTPIANAISVATGIRPPEKFFAATGDKQIQDCRHCHPARSDDEEKAPLLIRRSTIDEFAFDLQSDEREEDRHQAIVDPQMRVHRPEPASGQLVAAWSTPSYITRNGLLATIIAAPLPRSG